MKRMIAGMMLLGMVIGLNGCVAVAGNNFREGQRRFPLHVDGHVYVVDVASGKVMRLPVGALENAGPFRPIDKDDD